jgi:surfactin synthase thioesterase subunit
MVVLASGLASRLAPVPGFVGKAMAKIAPSIGQDRIASTWVRVPRPNPTARLRLFCFPYGGGGASLFREWAEGLPSWIEVCPIQLPSREDRIRAPAVDRLDVLVEALWEAMRGRLDVPFALYGCSMGALIAYELTRVLSKRHDVVPVHVFFAAFGAPNRKSALLERLGALVPDEPGPMDELLQAIAGAGLVESRILGDAALMSALWPVLVLRADFRLVSGYVHEDGLPLDVPITVFGDEMDGDIRRDDLVAWAVLTNASFRIDMLPGGHLFMNSARVELWERITHDLMRWRV